MFLSCHVALVEQAIYVSLKFVKRTYLYCNETKPCKKKNGDVKNVKLK